MDAKTKKVILNISYPCTNEVVPAVIAGLSPKRDDVVISVAGSGDIPFAIAPYVKKVYAVDKNSSQIEFMKLQKGFLEARDFDSFCHTYLEDNLGPYDVSHGDLPRRKAYFSNKFEEVLGSLSKIEMINADIIPFMRGLKGEKVFFVKVYLSNILHVPSNFYYSSDFIRAFFGLKEGGLVYDVHKRERLVGVSFPKEIFELELKRTRKAERAENRFNSENYNWVPQVYRKVG